MQLFFQLISAFYGSSSSLAYAQLYRSSSAAHLGLHTSSFSSSFLPDIYIHADHMNTAAHIENGAQLARDKWLFFSPLLLECVSRPESQKIKVRPVQVVSLSCHFKLKKKIKIKGSKGVFLSFLLFIARCCVFVCGLDYLARIETFQTFNLSSVSFLASSSLGLNENLSSLWLFILESKRWCPSRLICCCGRI